VQELRQLQDENKRLKKLVADLSLDKAIPQDVVTKKMARPALKAIRRGLHREPLCAEGAAGLPPDQAIAQRAVLLQH